MWEWEEKGTGAGGEGVGRSGIDAASVVVGVVGAEQELLFPPLLIRDDEVHAEEDTEADDELAPIFWLMFAPRRFNKQNGLFEVDVGTPDVEPPGREK